MSLKRKDSYSKNRDKSYYINMAKRARQGDRMLVPDIAGFLVTCNFREKEAIREAYNVLNEFADALLGPEVADTVTAGEDTKDEDTEKQGEQCKEEDIEAALDKEKQELAEVRKKVVKERRFQLVSSGIQNVLFVRTTVPDPVELVLSILKNIRENQQQRTRFLLRLVPVEKTCKAFEENVAAAVKEVLPKWFQGKGGVTYCIVFKSRLNNSFSRDDAVTIVGDVVRELNSEAKVEFKCPELVIMVEVMKSICCLAVLPQYFDFKKYNLIELVAGQKSAEAEKAPTKNTDSKTSAKPDEGMTGDIEAVVKSEKNNGEVK